MARRSQDRKPNDATGKHTEAASATSSGACAKGAERDENANPIERGKHKRMIAAASMGMNILTRVSKYGIAAAEVLQKVRIAAPPSTGSIK